MSGSLALCLVLVGAGSGLAQSGGHDSTQPIEITADRLEVEQEKKLATFSGNVDAVQGDLVLSADQLRVYYEGDEQDAGLAAGSGGSIRRIEAEGDVSLASPEESARGEQGVYDVRVGTVTLEGSVVLTRDDNVISGDRLEMELETGVSRVLAQQPEPGVADGRGRVRALFTPREDEAAAPPPAVPALRP